MIMIVARNVSMCSWDITGHTGWHRAAASSERVYWGVCTPGPGPRANAAAAGDAVASERRAADGELAESAVPWGASHVVGGGRGRSRMFVRMGRISGRVGADPHGMLSMRTG